jgi:Ca2+-transporting ATPase
MNADSPERDDRSQPSAADAGDPFDDRGLTESEARLRLERLGPNLLPVAGPPGLLTVFLRQFLSPLIYILLVAAAVSTVLGDVSDGLFIGAVLIINGIVGTVQEYSANNAAHALRHLEQPRAMVIRDGAQREIASRDLVPGDLVLLEAGARVPADLELTGAIDLRCDESLLTGESAPVTKLARNVGDDATPASHRALAGTIVVRGRGRGVAVATGAATAMGRIASEVGARVRTKPPLLMRMERLARSIAVAVAIAIVLLVLAGLWRGLEARELFMMAVGLAVSAIPEGLPVAISVALAIGMRRMAKVGVVVRSMTAVESLGSCTLIATDKTGTITLNELTVTDIVLPDGTSLECETGQDLDACAITSAHHDPATARRRVADLLTAATLPNEASLAGSGYEWTGQGDTVDVALLSAARKGGIQHQATREEYPLLTRIPYEPDQRYAASFHQGKERVRIFVKGAPETLIAMCDRMDMGSETARVDRAALIAQKDEMAARGLRVLAFASGEIASAPEGGFDHTHLENLTFLGLAGLQDPLRPEVREAIRRCRSAGIEVVMLTGDDPATARSIASHAGLVFRDDEVATGDAVRQAEASGTAQLDELTRRVRIYARVAPDQKLAIVLSLARNGHFVAVTGDGVNDAPALRHAHVGVAMGRRGTDVAKESAALIITDDNFASIVAGIAEGRVAYANIRKVVFMLVSTGAAEVALFLLAIPLGLPMPLLPVQLLWLNLVTNGIQDVALATERAEGDELDRPPRRPSEPIFDRLMLRRIVQSVLVMGGGGFAVFWLLLEQGYAVETARNLLLLLLVLFENVQTLNSRSERHSAVRLRLFDNPFLILAILAAQGLHVGAMFVPGLSGTLGLAPVSPSAWAALALIAGVLFLVVELDKWRVRRDARRGLSAQQKGPRLRGP